MINNVITYDLAEYDPSREGARGKAECELFHDEEFVPDWIRERVAKIFKRSVVFSRSGKKIIFGASLYTNWCGAELSYAGLGDGCRFRVTSFSTIIPLEERGKTWVLVIAHVDVEDATYDRPVNAVLEVITLEKTDDD